MVTTDKRVDSYLQKAPDFAKPILNELRAVIHAACPDVVETMKWSRPAFDYKGLLCGMAAFKQHCTFGFWKHELVVGKTAKADEAWGSFGRMTTVKDLPSKAAMTKLIKKAMQLNDDGVSAPRAKTAAKAPASMHPDFKKALATNKKAQAQFDGLSPSCKREYLTWIAEAKRDETRQRRIADAISWIAEGKQRNWKYEKC